MHFQLKSVIVSQGALTSAELGDVDGHHIYRRKQDPAPSSPAS